MFGPWQIHFKQWNQVKTINTKQKYNFCKIIFQNFPKSVENRFRQVPQVDLDLQNSKKYDPRIFCQQTLFGIDAYAPMLIRTRRTFWESRIEFWEFWFLDILGPRVVRAPSTFFRTMRFRQFRRRRRFRFRLTNSQSPTRPPFHRAQERNTSLRAPRCDLKIQVVKSLRRFRSFLPSHKFEMCRNLHTCARPTVYR